MSLVAQLYLLLGLGLTATQARSSPFRTDVQSSYYDSTLPLDDPDLLNQSTQGNSTFQDFTSEIPPHTTEKRNLLTNCLILIDLDHCSACENNYILSSDLTQCTLSSIENCLEWSQDDPSRCSICIEGFLPDTSDICVSSSLTNCERTILGDGSKCFKCQDGFLHDIGDQCLISSVSHCVLLMDSDHCAACENNYILSSDLTQCTPSSIENCIEWSQDDPSRCAICIEGFLPDASDACIYSSLANCEKTILGDGSKCFTCQAGFLHDIGDQCLISSVSHCVLLMDSDHCIACERTYMLSSDLTQCTLSYAENCIEFSQDNPSWCVICQAGYLADENYQCVKCDAKCKACYGTIQNCNECVDSTMTAAPNCECQNGYYFDGVSTCMPCDSKCLTCQGSSTNCSVCKDSALMNSTPECNCIDGYDWDATTSSCLSI